MISAQKPWLETLMSSLRNNDLAKDLTEFTMGKTVGICVTAQLTHCTPVQSEATASRWSWLFSNKLLLTGSWTRQEVITQYCEYTIEHWNVHFKMANLDCIITHLFFVCVTFRGQQTTFWSWFFLPCKSQEPNGGHKAWQQASLPTKPPFQSYNH